MAAIDRDRALALVGTPFRAQGRDPASGLDCIGLVLCACGLPANYVRQDYRLRGDYRQELRDGLDKRFRRVSKREVQAGDLILASISDDQCHLVILTERGFVHADASLRRVVETPGLPPWSVIGYYRRRLRSN